MQDPTKYDAVFWIETEKVHPNPYQPRHDFDSMRLNALAESIRQYGVLQPLVVTRMEHTKPDGGISSEYELIAGERRLRASKLIGLREVPAVIRGGKEDRRVKLELAIIENLQREDLNAIDRARALSQLSDEFGISHAAIGAKVGRSREYVSNSIRLLQLPEEIQQSVVNKELTEGHARALLMLTNRPKEMNTLFRDIVLRKTSVRITEQLVRRIARDKIRKKNKTPEMMDLEKSLTETLGTRVVIENRPKGGRLLIEFFSPEDLAHIADAFAEREAARYVAASNKKEKKDENLVPEGVVPVSYDKSFTLETEEKTPEEQEEQKEQKTEAEVETEQTPEMQFPEVVEETVSIITQTPDAVTEEASIQSVQNIATNDEETLNNEIDSIAEVSEDVPSEIPEPEPEPELEQENIVSEEVSEQIDKTQEIIESEKTEPEKEENQESDEQDDDLYSVHNFTV